MKKKRTKQHPSLWVLSGVMVTLAATLSGCSSGGSNPGTPPSGGGGGGGHHHNPPPPLKKDTVFLTHDDSTASFTVNGSVDQAAQAITLTLHNQAPTMQSFPLAKGSVPKARNILIRGISLSQNNPQDLTLNQNPQASSCFAYSSGAGLGGADCSIVVDTVNNLVAEDKPYTATVSYQYVGGKNTYQSVMPFTLDITPSIDPAKVTEVQGISSTIYTSSGANQFSYPMTLTLTNTTNQPLALTDPNHLVAGGYYVGVTPNEEAGLTISALNDSKCVDTSLAPGKSCDVTATAQATKPYTSGSISLGVYDNHRNVVYQIAKHFYSIPYLTYSVQLLPNFPGFNGKVTVPYIAVRWRNHSGSAQPFYLGDLGKVMYGADASDTFANTDGASEMKFMLKFTKTNVGGQPVLMGSWDKNTFPAGKNGQYIPGASIQRSFATNTVEMFNQSALPDGSQLVYLPLNDSGVMYLAMSSGFADPYAGTTQPAQEWEPPADGQPLEPRFQKVEYTYEDNNPGEANGLGALFINVSNVKQFSIPLSIESLDFAAQPGMSLLTPVGEVTDARYGVKQTPFQAVTPAASYPTLHNIFDAFSSGYSALGTDSGAKAWQATLEKHDGDVWRVMAPSAMVATNNPFKGYLDQYMQNLLQYYKTHVLYIDPQAQAEDPNCFLIQGKTIQTTSGETLGFQSVTTSGNSCPGLMTVNNPADGEIVTTSSGSYYTDSGALTSWAMINAGTQGQLVHQNIFRAIYSARVAGLLPNDSMNWSKAFPISSSNLAGEAALFYNPENFLPPLGMTPNPGKPLYGLYAKIMSEFENVYSYTFSDFLNQSGLIQANTTYAPVTITIGQLGKIAS